MHQSLPGTRLTGLWWNNSLSFNLIFFVSFPLRLFVCSHDFGCCLSSGGMYTCSSQTLVHLSALRCFWWSAMLLFSSSFFLHVHAGFFFLFVDFLIFISCLSIDSFESVCLFSLSFSWWFVHTLLSLWVVDRRSPGSFATPWSRLGELMLCDHYTEQSDPLFSVCCGGHSL